MFSRIKNKFKNYLNDTSGNMALIWAFSGMVVIFATGAAYDATQVTKAKQMAQLAADNMALAASVAVDFDNDDKYVEGRHYGYKDIGGPYEDFTDSMYGVVEYDVLDKKDPKRNPITNAIEYDANGNPIYNKLIARATVHGEYKTAFMAILGKEKVPFKATSDVAYAAREGKPASIFFVVDNSGSMGWRDSNGHVKISSLKASMRSFMSKLNVINASDDDLFRTALFPYSYRTIYGRISYPKWGTLPTSKINSMYASGGTRSTTALKLANRKFNPENQIHQDANGEGEPLKFLIFMSDGSNNGAYYVPVCHTEQVWVPGKEKWVLNWYGNQYTYYSYRYWFRWYNVTYYPAAGGHYEDQEVCVQELYSPVNEASLAQCTAMKNKGVQIYTIAYDLGNPSDQEGIDEKNLAIQFMKDCSSGEDVYYSYALNGTDLQQVFNEIGEAVVKEVIRVKR